MDSRVQMAFAAEGITLPLKSILPLRTFRPEFRKSPSYKRLMASMREIGLIEPLIVFPQPKTAGPESQYILLDGHTRLDVLRELGAHEVLCLVATDDEAFTYNHKVSVVQPIQEHFMLLKALENGVSEQRIAATLNVDLKSIRQKRDLLNGICPEAVVLLKERCATAGTFREMRKVAPMRQIEMAELMIAANNYSASYAKCLIAATPEKDLLVQDKSKDVEGLKPEDISRMEREMEILSRDFRLIEETYGRNTLNMVLGVAYLRKLLESAPVVRHLSQRYSDILGEFQKLVEASDLRGGT